MWFASHKRVAGSDIVQADRRGNVAGTHFRDLVAIVGVHLHHPTDALSLLLHRVEDGIATTEHSRIDPEERQRADERIVGDLERETSERRVVARLAPPQRYAVCEHTFDRL